LNFYPYRLPAFPGKVNTLMPVKKVAQESLTFEESMIRLKEAQVAE
jgi:hypothetical protein